MMPEFYNNTPRLHSWYRVGKCYAGYKTVPNGLKRIVTEVIHRVGLFADGRVIEGANSVYVLLNIHQHETKKDTEL